MIASLIAISSLAMQNPALDTMYAFVDAIVVGDARAARALASADVRFLRMADMQDISLENIIALTRGCSGRVSSWTHTDRTNRTEEVFANFQCGARGETALQFFVRDGQVTSVRMFSFRQPS